MNNEWYTPPAVLNLARSCMRGKIDVDIASCDKAQAYVQAKKYYTLENPFDFSTTTWQGCSLWCNPPYETKHCFEFCRWVAKKTYYYEAMLLIQASTETEYFKVAAKSADLVTFSEKRIKFIDGENLTIKHAGRRGHALMYFGPNAKEVKEKIKQSELFYEIH